MIFKYRFEIIIKFNNSQLQILKYIMSQITIYIEFGTILILANID